jgi:hypothetical protein
MKFPFKDLLYGTLCAATLGFLTWADATGYVLYGQATKNTPQHSNAQYHK